MGYYVNKGDLYTKVCVSSFNEDKLITLKSLKHDMLLTCHINEFKEDFYYIDDAYAVCVVIDREADDLFLGVSRKTNHNDFGLPGGKVEDGETIYDAIIREVKEETGADLIEIKFIALMPCINPDGIYRTTAVFEANHFINGSYKTNEPHVVDWVTKEKIMEGSFGEFNKKVFEILNKI